jgi:phosphate:Na+ symporter
MTVAAQAAGDHLDVVLVVVTLLGGLALFLHGLDRVTDSLKLLAGDRMRAVLERLTANRFAGAATGAAVTAVIQSSSVTTVLVVGFITSGLMTLGQSIGVILGADVGTTITAQIIAFDVGRYALAAVAAGFAWSFFSRGDDRRNQGLLVMGLGLVFFGMSVMSDAVSPLRTNDVFLDAMASMENPAAAIAAAAAFTAAVQSSSATIGIVIVLAGQGLVTLDAGIALVLGANVGTSATALIAAAGKPREAMRAAAVHALTKAAGVALWIGFIGGLGDLVSAIGGGTGRRIANAHTIFNVVNTALFIGFTPQLGRLAERLVPDRPEPAELAVKARYLDRELLKTPSLALDRARLELLRMADRARRMVAAILPAMLHGTRGQLLDIEAMDDEIDSLHGQIITYLGKVSQTRLSEASSEELSALLAAANDLEAIGDIVETNLVALGLARLQQGLVVSEVTTDKLTEFHRMVQEALELAMLALTQRNVEAAGAVVSMKTIVNDLERVTLDHEADRLVAPEPHRVATYRFEIDIVANLKRVFYFTKRIARLAVPPQHRAGL